MYTKNGTPRFVNEVSSPTTPVHTVYDSKDFNPSSHRHPPTSRRERDCRVVLPSAKVPPRVVVSVLLFKLERTASALPASEVGTKNNHAEEPVSQNGHHGHHLGKLIVL